MAMRDRYLTFDGVNLKTEYGLIYSSFEEELPEPKVITVDIPAGTDLDITSALGPVGWHNGTHVLKFLLYGGTQAGRLEKLRGIKALMHGVRASYKLSWDSAYTYTGRATVEVEHRTEEADLITITIDRSPWRVSTRETHVVDCHPYGWYDLEGSKRFHTVRAKFLQGGGGDVAVEEPLEYTTRTTGTHTLAADAYAGETVWLKVDSWVMYVDDDENLVVNSYSISGSNFVVNADYTVTDGDIYFADADNQKVTVDFYRWDV